mmetsp:Transcript_8406/g.14057  ORF Transcript_8406/g.14057 Transcript_8406/m.14057 type:complete len:134 (+) Transcript_8406:950-1351(+)
MKLVKTDCEDRYLISQESIYLRQDNRWFRHRLDLIDFDGGCYLNFGLGNEANSVKVGTSFLADYFAYFDASYGTVDLITLDDQAYPSSKDYNSYDYLPYIEDYYGISQNQSNFLTMIQNAFMDAFNKLIEFIK